MEQARALNALLPFVVLAKSATSARAASDLVTQATSAPNTYVFAELLQQPNIQALSTSDQYGAYLQLLRCFAWGTWEQAKNPSLPALSDAQSTKLKLLSLVTIASERAPPHATESNLSYGSLMSRLDLASPIELEQLVTQAIYSNLITATLNPAKQTVVVASVAPLRDLAPGNAGFIVSELAEWSARCSAVLADLEAEITRVKAEAARRHAREAKAERQIQAAHDAGDRNGRSQPETGHSMASNLRPAGLGKKPADDGDDDDAALDMGVNASGSLGGGRKKSKGSIGGYLSRMTGGR